MRRERKYPLSSVELLAVRGWQREHGRGFRRAYPPRVVSSVYFDSPDWDRYADNLSGASRRAKCRLRWYGDLSSAATVTFEVKWRRSAIGGKWLQGIAARELGLPSLPVGALYRRLRPLLRADLRPWLDEGHRPTLYDRFRREYYATSSGVRMTIDTGIGYALLHGGSLDALRVEPAPTPAVLEIKYPPERVLEVEEALGSLPFRATRCSKYGLGIAQLLAW
jgi:hypothetical protein